MSNSGLHSGKAPRVHRSSSRLARDRASESTSGHRAGLRPERDCDAEPRARNPTIRPAIPTLDIRHVAEATWISPFAHRSADNWEVLEALEKRTKNDISARHFGDVGNRTSIKLFLWRSEIHRKYFLFRPICSLVIALPVLIRIFSCITLILFFI